MHSLMSTDGLTSEVFSNLSLSDSKRFIQAGIGITVPVGNKSEPAESSYFE